MPDTITIGEVKKLIEEEGISPSEIFGRDSLIDDPIVKGYVKAEVQEATTGEYVSRKRKEEGLDKDRAEWEKEKKEKDEKIKKLEIDSAKVKATELFNTKIKERKLDKQQESFLKSKQDDFIPEDPENLEKEVDKFMDKNVEEYNTTAKIFGQKVDEKKEETKGGGEPGEGGSGEDNELIPD